jgi:hypothetical protein
MEINSGHERPFARLGQALSCRVRVDRGVGGRLRLPHRDTRRRYVQDSIKLRINKPDGFWKNSSGRRGSACSPVNRPAPADGHAGGTFAPEGSLKLAGIARDDMSLGHSGGSERTKSDKRIRQSSTCSA